MIKILQLHKPC